MKSSRRRGRARQLVFFFAAAAAGCRDAGPTTPVQPAPLAVSLAVTPPSGPVSTIFHPLATVTGIEPESLTTVRYQWDFDGNGVWDTDWQSEPDAEVFYHAIGPELLRVGVRDGRNRTATGDAVLVVTGGTEDGSRDFVLVPGGPFTRGSDPNEGNFGNQRPEAVLDLAAFEIGRTEVTAAAFAEVLDWAWHQGRVQIFDTYSVVLGNSGVLIFDMLRSPVARRANGEGFASRPGRDNEPVAGVSWFGAVLWCNWRSEIDDLAPCYDTGTWTCDFDQNGYRLPTEAEWEKAARGGQDLAPGVANPIPEREYPWGDLSADCQHANYSECVFGSAPVGSYPLGRSPYGIDDMSGNAAEWCNDWYEYDYYSTAPPIDPRGPASSSTLERIQRGGSWDSPFGSLASCTVRLHERSGSTNQTIGFRAVRRP